MSKIKGWKKEPHDIFPDEKDFWRNETNQGFVSISEVEKGAPARGLGKYQLQINTPQEMDTRYFNDLTKARKYATDYMKTTPGGKIDDLSYGVDGRGDYAYFMEEKHVISDWKVDKKAATGSNEAIFFRLIKDGKQTRSHGWIEDDTIVQWG